MGVLILSLKIHQKKKQLPEVDLMSCTSIENLKNYSFIKDDLNLSTKVSQEDFVKYMNRIINSRNDYNIAIGWVAPKKAQSFKTPVDYFRVNQCVASNQYSKSCKLFLFPLEFLQPNWMKFVPFFTSANQIDLCFFLVMKLEQAQTEKQLVPENILINTPTIFKVLFPHNDKRAELIKTRVKHIHTV